METLGIVYVLSYKLLSSLMCFRWVPVSIEGLLSRLGGVVAFFAGIGKIRTS